LAKPVSAAESATDDDDSCDWICQQGKRIATLPQPGTPAEFERLLNGYHGGDCFFGAVDGIFQQEARDDAWAWTVEQDVRAVAGAVKGLTITTGECRSSTCRFDFAYGDGVSAPESLRGFSHPLESLVAGTNFAVKMLYRTQGSQRDAVYLFSEKPPPHGYHHCARQYGTHAKRLE